MSVTSQQRAAEHWPCSNEQYHADHSHVSNSMKKVFRRSRKKFHGMYVTGEIARPKPTDDLIIGSATHALYLDGRATFDSLFCVAPKINRRTNAGKAEFAEFVEQSKGKTVLDDDQFDLVRRMADALDASPTARALFQDDGPREFAIRWHDRIPRKVRFDKISGSVIPDLKTSADADPASFSSQAARLEYYLQAAWYMDGYRAFFGDNPEWVFVVVDKESFEIFFYQPDHEDLERAHDRNQRTIDQMAKCFRTGDWRTPGAEQTMILKLPAWDKYADSYDVEV